MTTPAIAVCSVAILAIGPPALAQDEGRIGVTMSYPHSAGVVWRISDRMAVRPAFSFTRSQSEGSEPGEPVVFSFFFFGRGEPTLSFDGRSLDVRGELDLLVYLNSPGRVRMYVAPGYVFSRFSTTTTVTIQLPAFPPAMPVPPPPQTETLSSKSDSHAGALSLGVQFTPHRRFGVYGEAGASFSTSDRDNSRSRRFDTRTRVGMVFYLK